MATGDIKACTILGTAPRNGWVAEITIEGWAGKAGAISYTYGFAAGSPDNQLADAAGPVFTVVSEGYDASATLGTVSRTIYGTDTLRQAYPNNASLDEVDSAADLVVRVSLSDFIYNDDKNGGAGTSGTDPTVTIPAGWANDGTNDTNAVTDLAVTNNSALDYPQVVGRWAWPGYYIVDADFLLEAVCYQRFGRNHKPVACVKFDAADQSAHSVTQQTVTGETLSTRSHTSGLKLPVYAATMPVTGLNDEVIDCRFRAYPWVGDENSVLDTDLGTAQPSEDWGPLHLVNNAGGTYGIAYAAVDGVGGAPAVATTEASARTTPYASIDAAMVGLKSYINTNFGRLSCDGGIVVLESGSYAAAGVGAGTMANSQVFTLVRPASGVSGSAVTITGNGNTALSGWIQYQGLKIADSGAVGALQGSATASLYWFDDLVDFNCTGTGNIYNVKVCYVTNGTWTRKDGGFWTFGGSKSPYKLIRGTDMTGIANGEGQATWYCILACSGYIAPRQVSKLDAAGHAFSDNIIAGFNEAVTGEDNWLETDTDAGDDLLHGLAIVGNVVECLNTLGSLCTGVYNDSSLGDSNHAILWHNTFAGARLNIAYNDTGSVIRPHMNYSQRFNSLYQWNNKGDIFTSDGNDIGNWPVLWMVGSIGNQDENPLFTPEFGGITYDTGSAVYVNDQSGAGPGGGDYTPDTGSPLLNRIVSAAEAPMAYDLRGTAIQDNGDAGGIQVTAPAGGGGGGSGGALNRGVQMTALMAGGTPDPGYVYGTPRCFVEEVPLSGQAIADTIDVCRMPKGAVMLYGSIIADTALGASTIAIGVPAYPDKYRATDILAGSDRPELFGLAAGIGATLAEEETVILTVDGAAFPASGTLRVALVYAFD